MNANNSRRRARKLSGLVLLAIGLLALKPGGAYAQAQQPTQPLPPPAPQAFGHFFPETEQAVGGTFYNFWYNNGALARIGYPISTELQERSETDNKLYLMQYFERGVIEWHPELRAPNNVQLSPIGTYLYKALYPRGATGQQPNTTSGSVSFRDTGKRLGGKFLDFWRKNGGQTGFGSPITDEFMQQSVTDGKTYRVQYFQRAIFELHPELKPPADVMLVMAGSLRYDAKYQGRPRWSPALKREFAPSSRSPSSRRPSSPAWADHTPAKQSACNSSSMVYDACLSMPRLCCTRWPHSCARIVTGAKSPSDCNWLRR